MFFKKSDPRSVELNEVFYLPKLDKNADPIEKDNRNLRSKSHMVQKVGGVLPLRVRVIFSKFVIEKVL